MTQVRSWTPSGAPACRAVQKAKPWTRSAPSGHYSPAGLVFWYPMAPGAIDHMEALNRGLGWGPMERAEQSGFRGWHLYGSL